VDEDACVGCGFCPSVARHTFVMNEDVNGKARVVAQGADPEDTVEEARACCPVDSIYYVPYEDLQKLEEQRAAREQELDFNDYAAFKKHFVRERDRSGQRALDFADYDGEDKGNKDQREYRNRKAARLWKDRASGKVKADRAEQRAAAALDAIMDGCDAEDLACGAGVVEPAEGVPPLNPALVQTIEQMYADECDLEAPEEEACAPPIGARNLQQDCNEECEMGRQEVVEAIMHDECDLEAPDDDACAPPVIGAEAFDVAQDCNEECDMSRQAVIEEMLMKDIREMALPV